jgi:hypothetical protein
LYGDGDKRYGVCMLINKHGEVNICQITTNLRYLRDETDRVAIFQGINLSQLDPQQDSLYLTNSSAGLEGKRLML